MQIDFNKLNGLVPAIVQDAHTGTVLMLGFMNEAAYQKTLELKKVTFFSRSKNRLWTKGEESGHYLELISMKQDCDNDTILVKANPIGATCHTGTDTCWNEENKEQFSFLYELESIIQNRKNEPNESSYTSSLFKKGINKIAQKVGEEAVELVIEAKDNNADLFKNEAADLLYHYLILLAAKDFTLQDIVTVLKARHNK
ncbi:MAG: bifunctional phosphoribosyl-AMP cyclohydrolase/phosphoribosyl-ATP diphosphatase HisIE [Sphingobacteriales bacterium]|jgi:phosphoribosyl-ATP pyrophosphohydrolase/phosphoribosyl-AMP cyclohydrolase|nr:MAG: bifunctional phosphoribosyl-AMP cyclohydrolase/phosphoribosyl-ATP diphosphatase HisIE [Sphingobacteriales bacterium]